MKVKEKREATSGSWRDVTHFSLWYSLVAIFKPALLYTWICFWLPFFESFLDFVFDSFLQRVKVSSVTTQVSLSSKKRDDDHNDVETTLILEILVLFSGTLANFACSSADSCFLLDLLDSYSIQVNSLWTRKSCIWRTRKLSWKTDRNLLSSCLKMCSWIL